MNQNMMGMQQMQLPNVPPVKELWKDEKTKYRHWMILFGFGLLAIFALLLTSTIMNATSVESLRQTDRDYANANYAGDKLKDYLSGVERKITLTYIVFPSIQASIIAIAAAIFFLSLPSVYKEKSFARLSGFPTLMVGIGAIFSLFTLIRMLWTGGGAMFDSPGGIFQFILYFIVLFSYLFGSMQVSKIRRVFALSERVAKIKASPMYQQAQQQAQAMNAGQAGPINSPYGPAMSGTATATGSTAAQSQQNPEAVQQPVVSKEKAALQKMKVADLKKVAIKLSISGSATMKKPELIENILRVSNKK